MNILQVSPTFYPARAYGGPIEVAYQLCKRLARRGHQVTVFTTDAGDSSSRLKSGARPLDGITVHYFRNLSNFMAYQFKLFLPPGIRPALKKGIKGFDLVHCHDLRTAPDLIACYYARKAGIPYLLQPHGVVPLLSRVWGKRVIDRLFARQALLGAAWVFAVGQAEGEACWQMGVEPGRVEVLPHGIDLSEFASLPPRGQFRAKYNLGQKTRLILFLGRLHRVKGPGLLVEAFSPLAWRSDIKLAMVGPDDGYLPRLKQLITKFGLSSEVLLTGPLYGPEKLEAYRDADVYVLPSFYEAFGLTILEAWACGLPIITTDTNALVDVIHNQGGLVVPCQPQALTAALARLLEDEKLRQEFGHRGQELASRYDWEEVTSRVEQRYYQIVERH